MLGNNFMNKSVSSAKILFVEIKIMSFGLFIKHYMLYSSLEWISFTVIAVMTHN